MQAKLTLRTVNKLVPAEKVYEVRDTDIKGFLLRLEPTGKATYYLEYKNEAGQRRRYRLGTAGNLTPEQARDAAKQASGKVALGTDIQAERTTARREAELAKQRTLRVFIEDVYQPWSEQHHSRGSDTPRKISAAFADLLDASLEDLTPWVVEKWRTQARKAGKKASTINREIASLKALLNKAVEWQYIERSPLAGGALKPLKSDDQPKVRFLSDSEEQRLRDALDRREARMRAERASANEWRRKRGHTILPDLYAVDFVDYLKPMVLLALNTGLRRGELFSLPWACIDFTQRLLTVEGEAAKSHRTRHIPLNHEAYMLLRRWWNQATDPAGLVFPSQDGARINNIKKAWRKLLKDGGISNFRFHDLRHTFASNLVMAGVDLNTVRELLGHSDIQMTLRYAHLAPQHKAKAVELLSCA